MTYSEKRTETIAHARNGHLRPLCAFVEKLRWHGLGQVGAFDYNDTVAFLTGAGECTAEECEEWFYEMDANSEEMSR